MIEPGRSGHRNRAVARHAARQVSTKKNGFRLTWILTHLMGARQPPGKGAGRPAATGIWGPQRLHTVHGEARPEQCQPHDAR